MYSPKFYPDALNLDLAAIAKDSALTIYGISQIVGAETDEPLKTIHKRWTQWVNDEPKTLALIKQDLAALGYEIKVFKV
jgi:hypothetical protein